MMEKRDGCGWWMEFCEDGGMEYSNIVRWRRGGADVG